MINFMATSHKHYKPVNTVFLPSLDYLLLQPLFPSVPGEPSSRQSELLQNFLWLQLPVHNLCSEGLSTYPRQYYNITVDFRY